VPVLLSETNIRGLQSDRASWLKYTLEQCELALANGVDLRGYCWFPYVDSCDWDSLLARPAGRADPVGVVGLSREPGLFAEVWRSAALGAPSSTLPAYRFQSPCSEQLTNVTERLSHWNWQDPPARAEERGAA
jgi:hypothetical protein